MFLIIILLLVIFFALGVLRSFRLNEWIVFLLGSITPFYILFSGFYLFNHTDWITLFIPAIKINLPLNSIVTETIIKFSFVAFLLFMGMSYWMPNNNRMVIQIRKTWTVMLILLLIVLFIPFLFEKAGIESAILTIVPLAAFISNLFLYSKRTWLPNLFFILSVVIITYNNWLLLKN